MSGLPLNKKVLVVDDFSTMRKIVCNVLKQIGYVNIIEAEDGVAALKILRDDKIDLVVTDWNMPRIDGLGLLENIRANNKTKDIPVLMVTAEGMKDNIITAVKAGVDNYVVKPFTAETLSEKISQTFKRREIC